MAKLDDLFNRAKAGDPNARVISVRGAREHNLKNVDLMVPRDQLVVFTGLSGSGKSSLAFDTIYAEGQRRYVESLSAYARQFLEMMQKPDVDQIDGLSPAISIEQKTTSKNPRSTVGTVTEIYDYMRLLWARVGIPYSPATGLPIESQTVSQMVDRVLDLPEKTRLYLLAPVVRGRKGEYRKEIAEFQKKGFQRLKIDGEYYAIDEAPALDKKFKHDIDVVVDRIVVRADIAARLSESFETALELTDGIAVVEYADEKDEKGKPKRIVFSSKFACPVSGFTIPEIEPRLFSFNNPFGACPTCGGIGHEMRIDEALVVDETLSLKRGAIMPWAKSTSPYYGQTLEAITRHYKASMTKPWTELSDSVRNAILYGSDGESIRMAYDDGMRAYEVRKPFEGVIPNLERRYKETESDWAREEIGRFMSETPCEACGGKRLKPEALAVKIAGSDIGDATALSVKDAARMVRRPVQEAHQEAERDRRPHPQGDPRAPDLPGRCGPGISDARPCLRHPLGRREPAHQAGIPDRLRTDRRALRARRTLDRPAPARQRTPARNPEASARPRQHGDRGGARRGRDPAGRLRVRHRPRRRHPWRPDRGGRNARRDLGEPEIPDRQVSHRRDVGEGSRRSAASAIRSAC